jgi:type IV pilus assembly protein PilB
MQKLRIGDLLLDMGAVTSEQIEAAVAEQKRRGNDLLLGEVVVQMGFCTEDDIVRALAAAYGVPYAKISPKLVDAKVIDLLPREFLEKHSVLPLFRVRQTLTVALPEPANVFLIEEIERQTGLTVQIVAATGRDIKTTLQGYLSNTNVFVIDEIIEDVDEEDISLIEKQVEDIANTEEVASDSPVVKLVNYLIYSAVKEGASDIHIEPQENALRVRFRVDGSLYEKLKPPQVMQAAVTSRIKIMSGLDISERRLPQDGGMHVLMEGRPIDLRVSTMPGRSGEKVVIRVIDNRNTLVNLEKLGFSYETLKNFKRAINTPNGIVLVTGPTGSGKSTTLYSVLGEISNDTVNICTVEDPIEFNLAGINQFQVNEKISFTFANALRSLLRQDPDVVMVGEIRDDETATVAVQAALTGHLVFSTLHTNDAPSTLTRLFNIGVEPYLVSASLVAVLAQRLVRKICTYCKEPYEPPVSVRRAVEKICGEVEAFYHGVGCAKCRNTGYSGRIGIFELLVPEDAMRDLITRKPTINELRKAAVECGMEALRADGLDKVKAGVTTVEEVFRVTA